MPPLFGNWFGNNNANNSNSRNGFGSSNSMFDRGMSGNNMMGSSNMMNNSRGMPVNRGYMNQNPLNHTQMGMRQTPNQTPQQMRQMPSQTPQQMRRMPSQTPQQMRQTPNQTPQQMRQMPNQTPQQMRQMPSQTQQQMRQMPNQNQQQMGQMQNQMSMSQRPITQMPAMNQPFAMGQSQMPQMPLASGGVRYEQIDEKTLADIKSAFAQRQENEKKEEEAPPQPASAVAEPITAPLSENIGEPISTVSIPSKTILDSSVLGRLEECMQNEHNASRFYHYLSDIAPGDKYQSYLNEIISEGKNRDLIFNQIYKKYKDSEFSPYEKLVSIGMSFRDGVSWAIEEEYRALKDLSGLYENIEDNSLMKKINVMLLRKMGDIQLLQMALR